MMDTTRIKKISSHLIRAQQAESEGEDKNELRYLLFAAQDTAELLEMWYNDRMDYATAMAYAESLEQTVARIKMLIGAAGDCDDGSTASRERRRGE